MMGKNRNFSEEDLVRGVREGSHSAFESLFFRYWVPVYRFCAGIIKDRSAGNDVAQEVFISLWNHRTELYCTNGTLRPLVYRIAKGKVLDYLRSLYVRVRKSAVAGEMPERNAGVSYNADAGVELRELSESIMDEIMRMPEKRRRVFLMSRMNDMSRREISDELDISESTVKKHIELALRQLRAGISSETPS